jgi:hypothetical protein
MTQVLKVSKTGNDVLTDTNINNFIFDSSANTFKILGTGLTSFTVDSDGYTVTVAHGQASVPAIYAFAKFANGYAALPNEREKGNSSPIQRYWLLEVDGSNMYFIFYKGSTGNYNASVSYFIFEPAL